MKTLPKISIIIPIYNVEEYITECLQSVMRQTYKGNMECILVDDCGKDNSIPIAESRIIDYKGPISFHILHHDHNRGLSAARNTGTDTATGDFIYYLDSDDYISEDCIEKLVEPLQTKKYDMVVGDYIVNGYDWGIPKLWLDEGEYSDDLLILYCTHKIYMMAWNKLIRKDFLVQYNLAFKEGMIHEDDHFSFRAFAHAEHIYVVSKQTYYYYVREDGIMSFKKYTQKNRDAYSETMLLVAQYINMHNKVRNELYEWLNNRYLKLVVQISQAQHISFYRIYKELRKTYSYPLMDLFRKKEIKKGKFIMRFHYTLLIPVGYLYLWSVSKCFGYDKI